MNLLIASETIYLNDVTVFAAAVVAANDVVVRGHDVIDHEHPVVRCGRRHTVSGISLHLRAADGVDDVFPVPIPVRDDERDGNESR